MSNPRVDSVVFSLNERVEVHYPVEVLMVSAEELWDSTWTVVVRDPQTLRYLDDRYEMHGLFVDVDGRKARYRPQDGQWEIIERKSAENLLQDDDDD